MSRLVRHVAILLAVATSSAALAAGVAVDPLLPAYTPRVPPLEGTLSLAGTGEMGPMVLRWMAIFNRAHPKVGFLFDSKGPPTAPAGLAAGSAQIGFLGRRFKDPELAALLAKQGHPPRQFTISAGAYSDKEMTSTMAVFVHPDNPLRRLTLAQLDAIFSATRKRSHPHPITSWGQLGLTGEWAGKPIHIYRTQTDRGRLDFVKEVALLDGEWKQAVKELPEDDASVATVASDVYGMCIAGLGYGTSGVRSLALAANEAGPSFSASLENVASRRYPLSRLVFIFVNHTPGKPLEPLIKEFLRVALSRDGQQAALAVGFLPLPAGMVRAELAKLE